MSTNARILGLSAFLFSAKAALGAALALLLFRHLHLPGSAAWSVVSAVIVIQPTLEPSLRMIWHRFGANMLGALVGATLTTLLGTPFVAVTLGVLLTGLICHYFRLEEALRPAYVAVVIVVLTKDSGVWYGSLDRVLSVMVGCVSALAISLIFDRLLFRFIIRWKGLIPTRDGGE